jgi:outer membrane protein OmpA-like peptidoglycan-associated protein
MRTYREGPGGRGLMLALLTLAVCAVSPLRAQERRYLAELGAAAAYQSFAGLANLKSAAGGLFRAGVWLPLNFSVEGEAEFASPKDEGSGDGISFKYYGASLLYNLPVGRNNWFHLKVGGGSNRFPDCGTAAPSQICGSAGVLSGGAGFRVGITPILLARGDMLLTRYKNAEHTQNLSNFGLNVGLSVMLGSKPIPDSDNDGILDNRDRCPDTPPGAQVDSRGCSGDSDSDGVPDGVDRCAATPPGATVDARGCTRDSDGDNIPDGIDRCPDTPSGVLVDPTGCAKDSDGDAIPDGLDRCSDTPQGATVDALGCPGDEDGDGVLDGLDKCPRTSAGATVNPSGCAAGQAPNRQGQARPQTDQAQPQPPQPAPSAAPTPPAGGVPAPRPVTRPSARDTVTLRPGAAARTAGKIVPGVIPDVTFDEGSARLQSSSYVALDSIADILLADSTIRVEIGAHTDNSTPPAAAQHLTNLQAEAVRTYLVTKGVKFQQVVPQGYGATVPLTPDNSPRGRLANRRVEIRLAPAAGP